MEQKLKRIKEKLELIREQGWERYRENFGVKSHRFELNPPIDERSLIEFERKHRIELPAEYRAFLLEVGHGGAGPYYGILPLEQWHRAADFVPGESLSDQLSKPWLPSPDLGFEMIGSDQPWRWVEQIDCPYEERYRGAMAICDQGCSYEALLIVSGEWRGWVCYVDMDDSGPPNFRSSDFLSWYEHWLDETLSGRQIWWY